MRPLYLAAPIALAAILAACGGGGGSSPVPSAPTTVPSTGSSPSTTQTVKFVLAIPLPSATTAARHRNFVSSATEGASISVTGPGGASAHAVVNLSSSSNACTTSGTLRTCSVNITVPVGLDTFTITTYDTAPVNGAIPSGAHELGIGSATATVSIGTPSVSISISGLIANLGSLPAFSSLPADGATHQVPIILAPTDFGDQPIVAGTSDPYANPITVTLSESGGSGHASLIFDGGTTGVSSATLAHSTDTVTLQYDGGGSPGYSITITASASGTASTSTVIGPLYAAASGLANDTLTLTAAPGTPVTVTLSEAGAPGTQQYSAGVSSGCTNVATATPVIGTGASATFTVSGGTVPSQDVCTILLSDGTVLLNLAITNEPNGVTPSPTPTPTATPTPTPGATATPTPVSGSGSVTIDGYAFTTQAISPALTPTQIVAGPDGNMWFGSSTGAYGWTNASAGSATGVGFTSLPSANTPSLSVASDGNVYFADSSDGYVLLVNPTESQQAILTASQAIDPTAIVSAPDGNVYFADAASDAIWKLSVAGQFTEYDAGGLSYSQMTVGPDGNLWMVDTGGGVEEFVLATQTITTVSGISGATAIAAGSDGNLWVSTTGTNIVRFAPASPGTQSSFSNGTTHGSQGIAGGVDGAMWYAVPGGNAVVRMALSNHATTIFSLSPSVPYDIAIGHDGSIWFTDQTNGQIGHLAP